MTRTEQRINMIGTIIAEQCLEDARALEINETTGWSYDVCWCDEEYIDARSWSRMEGDTLTEEEMALALEYAHNLPA